MADGTAPLALRPNSVQLRRVQRADDWNRGSWLIAYRNAIALTTIVFVIFTLHTYWSYAANQTPVSWGKAAYWSGSEWYTWALLAPPLFRLCRRWPLDRIRDVVPYIVIVVVFAVVQAVLEWVVDRAAVAALGDRSASIVSWLQGSAATAPSQLSYMIQRKFGFNTAIGIVLILIAKGWQARTDARERAEQAREYEKELVETRLALLRAQLNPHFLFNALNTLAALVHVDATRAERLILDLGDLLRAALAFGTTELVPLAYELHLAKSYLDIQQQRMLGRMQFEIRADTAIHATVPVLILQPLLENAVMHGIDRVPDGGTIAIACARDGDVLTIRIRDDGAGFGNGVPRSGSSGIGLDNVRQRLQSLYGHRAQLSIAPVTPHGTLVTLNIPMNDANTDR